MVQTGFSAVATILGGIPLRMLIPRSQVVKVSVSSCSEQRQRLVGMAESCLLEAALHPQDLR